MAKGKNNKKNNKKKNSKSSSPQKNVVDITAEKAAVVDAPADVSVDAPLEVSAPVAAKDVSSNEVVEAPVVVADSETKNGVIAKGELTNEVDTDEVGLEAQAAPNDSQFNDTVEKLSQHDMAVVSEDGTLTDIMSNQATHGDNDSQFTPEEEEDKSEELEAFATPSTIPIKNTSSAMQNDDTVTEETLSAHDPEELSLVEAENDLKQADVLERTDELQANLQEDVTKEPESSPEADNSTSPELESVPIKSVTEQAKEFIKDSPFYYKAGAAAVFCASLPALFCMAPAAAVAAAGWKYVLNDKTRDSIKERAKPWVDATSSRLSQALESRKN